MVVSVIEQTASERACALLESDVSLVYPPSQIGLAALLEETRANPGTGQCQSHDVVVCAMMM